MNVYLNKININLFLLISCLVVLEIIIYNFVEEKILAIEEIRREESKSKMLLAEAMAAGIAFIHIVMTV